MNINQNTSLPKDCQGTCKTPIGCTCDKANRKALENTNSLTETSPVVAKSCGCGSGGTCSCKSGGVVVPVNQVEAVSRAVVVAVAHTSSKFTTGWRIFPKYWANRKWWKFSSRIPAKAII